MIRLDSRYATGEVLFVRDPKTGSTIPTVFRTVYPPITYTTVHKWRHGDRVDSMGKDVAGKAHLWWKILDLNTENIDPLTIAPGSEVILG